MPGTSESRRRIKRLEQRMARLETDFGRLLRVVDRLVNGESITRGGVRPVSLSPQDRELLASSPAKLPDGFPSVGRFKERVILPSDGDDVRDER